MAELETEQQFCLRWNNFQANITSQFEALRDDEDFVDVTLACGGQKLGAHKVVLSACSPYFKELFKSNPCRHPIIFMRDVEYGQVSSLLEFMYAGEVNIAQTELSVFLRTAEALQIRGLTDASSHHKGIQDKLNTTNKVSLTNNVQTPIISDDENEVSSDKTNRPKTSRDKSPQSKHLASEHHTIKRPIKRVNNKENDYNSTPSPSQSKKHCSNGIRITPDPEVDGSRASPTENSNGSEIELNNGTFNSIANDESKIVTDLHSEMDMPSDIQPKIELPDYGSDDDSRHEEGLFSANALLGLEMVGNLSHALSGNLNAKPGTSYSGELHEQAGNRNGNVNRKLHSLDRRPCPVCGRLYSNLSNLRQHMRLIHNPEAVVCPLCKKIFKTKLYLKRHLVSFHHDNADYAQKSNTNTTNSSSSEVYISNNGNNYGNGNQNSVGNNVNEYYNSNGSYDYDESNYDLKLDK